MTTYGRGCVKTQNQHQTGGAKTIPHIPIAALGASGGVGFLWGVLQSEFSHSLGQNKTFPEIENPADAGFLVDG